MGYKETDGWWRSSTGYWTLYAPSITSTDDLKISPNLTDWYAQIELDGLGDLIFTHSSIGAFRINTNAVTDYFTLSYTSPDIIFTSLADKDIYFKTQGTGVCKFGTFTGSGDVAVNGFITIKDAGGTTRKLAVVP